MDGELSKFEHVLLGAHMAMCRNCRGFAEDVEWQTNAIRSAGLIPLTQPVTIPARRGWRWPAVGVSTAAIAASLAALAIGLRGPSTPQPQHSVSIPRVAQRGDTQGVRNLSAQTMAGNVLTLAEDVGPAGPGPRP
jgi:hypothetical protein